MPSTLKAFFALGPNVIGVVPRVEPAFWGGLVVTNHMHIPWAIPTINPQTGVMLHYFPMVGYNSYDIYDGLVIQTIAVENLQAGYQLVPTFSATNYLAIFPERSATATIGGLIFDLECSKIRASGLFSLKTLHNYRNISRAYNPPFPVFVYIMGNNPNSLGVGSNATVWLGYLVNLKVNLQVQEQYRVAGFFATIVLPPQ